MKFLHTADVHIGNIFDSDDIAYNILRRKELITTISRMLAYCREYSIQWFFIAGDLYEKHSCSYDEMSQLMDLFEGYKDIQIFIVAGNHDPYDDQSWYALLNWPKNVKLFHTNQWEMYQWQNIRIYGRSWKTVHMKEDSYFTELPSLDKSFVNIMLLHGDIYDKNSVYLPISVDKYLQSGFEYLALGHIHKKDLGKNYGYPGIPEPIKHGQNDRHGFIVGEIKEHRIITEFVPFAMRNYLSFDLVLANESMEKVREKIQGQLRGTAKAEDYVKITLKGYCENLNLEDIQDYFAEGFAKFSLISELEKGLVDRSVLNHPYYKEFVRRIEAKGLPKEVERIAIEEGVLQIMKEGFAQNED